MRELWIQSREGVEVPELKDDASVVWQIELAKTIDPGRKVRRVVVREFEDTLHVSVKIGDTVPWRGVERVHFVAELLKTRHVLRQQSVLVIQCHSAALQQLNVEPLERRPFCTRRRSSLFLEQSH